MEGQRQSPFQQLKGAFHAGHGCGESRHQIGQADYLPRWRGHRVGYGISVFLVGLAFAVSSLVAQVRFPFSLPGVLLLCVIVAIALRWAVGPAAFAILLSLFALDYLAVPPFGTLGIPAWMSVLQLLTFALVGMGIAVLAGRYEAACFRLFAREREAAVRETSRRARTLLVATSHELKAPLTVIKVSLQLCEQKLKRVVEPEASYTITPREFVSLLALLEQARQQVVLESRLVNDLLDVSRMQTDQLILRTVPCDLAAIVRETVERQQRVAFARTMHLVTPAEQAVPVLADPDRLGQVVTNYLSNALKYSSAECPIEIRLQVEGTFARVSVRDEGSGIPPAEQGSIWEPFYRVQSTRAHSGEMVGLGVGLYLCRNIIERHHGQVGIQSAPSKGSTFWFTMPLTEECCVGDDTV